MAIKLRRDQRLRLRDIAKVINTSVSFVGNVESTAHNAKYNLKHINLLAAYFDVSPRLFLPDTSLY
jgi:transcriptional regulator with XRE-family HTH domain